MFKFEDFLSRSKVKKTAYVIRGAPGYGKSTFAAMLADNLSGAYVCEADDYFIRPDGTYDFNFKLLKNAHEFCFKNVCKLLNSGCVPIISNTNTRISEFQKYIDAAKEAGYEVVVFRMTKKYKSIHGVPEEKVIQMHERIEDFTGEILIGEYK